LAVGHPLHRVVGELITPVLREGDQLLLDPACGGSHHLPLFIKERRSRETRVSVVDALVLRKERARVIVEIEETGFLPTKICGKFLTSAIATHFIHDSQPGPIKFNNRVLFVQVLDGSKFLMDGTRKNLQAELIEKRINDMLPLKGSYISEYRLFLPEGTGDEMALTSIRDFIGDTLDFIEC
jgi:hypothetical protein